MGILIEEDFGIREEYRWNCAVCNAQIAPLCMIQNCEVETVKGLAFVTKVAGNVFVYPKCTESDLYRRKNVVYFDNDVKSIFNEEYGECRELHCRKCNFFLGWTHKVFYGNYYIIRRDSVH